LGELASARAEFGSGGVKRVANPGRSKPDLTVFPTVDQSEPAVSDHESVGGARLVFVARTPCAGAVVGHHFVRDLALADPSIQPENLRAVERTSPNSTARGAVRMRRTVEESPVGEV